jgi:hypothetical protein
MVRLKNGPALYPELYVTPAIVSGQTREDVNVVRGIICNSTGFHPDIWFSNNEGTHAYRQLFR